MHRRSTVFACALVASGATAAVATLAAIASPPGTPAPPATLPAHIIRPFPHTAKLGTAVRSSNLSQRVFVSSKIGFALGAVGEAQYPAETTDGGASWKTFGPALHVNAAQAPLSVTAVGAVNRRVVYFYGSGQAVDVTSDGGKHWYRALAPELSLAVVPGAPGRLVWIVQDGVGSSGNAAVTWQYVSTDGGRLWRYSTALGGGA
ncbi:MAG TPA: hypothetical protein VG410_04855 [Solirubrobacteraceae bacterium]|jgi:photosystem II stability/assembly factor-like uncharacterized protein|nr:hypothetical protein [Solirubrobacteraceae bacterium]